MSRLQRSSGWIFSARRSLSVSRRRWHRGLATTRSIGLHLEHLEGRILLSVGLTVAQIRNYYDMNSLPAFAGNPTPELADGTGQTIAIVDAYNDPDILSDVDSFDQFYGLGGPSPMTLYEMYGASTSFLNVFNQQGQNITSFVSSVTGSTGQTLSGVFVPGTAPAGPFQANYAAEEALDVEWAHAIAPGARIDLVECNSAGNSALDSDQFAGFATAATLGSVVSMSTSYPEYQSSTSTGPGQSETADDSLFEHPGVTFIASTGDSGANGGYPAYSPNVLAVGGTTIYQDGAGDFLPEGGWSGSSGGFSLYEKEPSYQEGVQTSGLRTIPDVAFDAGAPVGFYDTFMFDGLGNETGDSIGAPCWAGLIAIVNQGLALKGVGPLNSDNPQETMQDLYQLGAQLGNPYFNDVTFGSNQNHTAGPGYDEVTGLGTPIVNKLIPALVDSGILVTTQSDLPGHTGTSLRDAVGMANSLTAEGLSPTITFASDLSGDTIDLDQSLGALPPLTGGTGTMTTIDAGELPGGITVDADFQFRVFNTQCAAVLDGLTITQGEAAVGDMLGGGGVTAANDLTIDNCSFIDNKELEPGAILPDDFASTVGGGGVCITNGNLTVENSTFTSNNAAGQGGAIFQSRLDGGALAVVNSTIAGNSAARSGGGIWIDLGTITNCTIVDNQAPYGGGIVGLDFAPILQNTIVAENSASAFGPDIYYRNGPLAASYCLIGNTGGIASIDGSHNITSPAYLGLSSLGSYGGPTQTIALLPAVANLPQSPAIGAGSVSLAADAQGNLTTDQRGLPRVVNGSVDIGAYQTQTTSASPVVNGTSSSSGDVTLQDAVNLAEAEAAAAAPTPVTITITIAANVSTIDLTMPVSVVGVTIVINSAGATTISGSGISKLFQISSGASVTLGNNTSTSGITLENADPIFGGISNSGTLTLVDVTFSGDLASEFGGAIFNTGMLTVSNCTFTNDSAGLAGGAIDNAGGTVILIDSTFSGNSAQSGGAIANASGSMTLTNCTITGNSAGSDGGGIENQGEMKLANTIIAGNTLTGSGGSGPDASGPLSSLGFNLIGDTSASSGWVSTDLQNVNPLLAPLGNYGGTTQTFALLPGSPAIGAGNNALIPSGITTDQRGPGFPRIVDGTIDIGAFESSGFTVSVSSGNNQSTDVGTLFPDPLVVTVASDANNEPVSGGVVTFTVPTSGASATFPGGTQTDTATIDGSGHATSSSLTANDKAGSYAALVSSSGAPNGASFALTNTPGPPAQLVIQTEPSQTATAGSDFSTEPVVYVEDQYGNLETSDNTTPVTASLRVGATQLLGTTTVTVSRGIAEFTNLHEDKAETIILLFTAPALIKADSSSTTVDPAAASRLSITAPATATAGRPFTITVTAFDPYDNVATGYRGTVVFTSSDNRASLPNYEPAARYYTFVASDGGVHTFGNGVTLRTSGMQTITVYDGFHPSISGSTSVDVGGAVPASVVATAGNGGSAVVPIDAAIKQQFQPSKARGIASAVPQPATANTGRARTIAQSDAARDRVLSELYGSLQAYLLAERFSTSRLD